MGEISPRPGTAEVKIRRTSRGNCYAIVTFALLSMPCYIVPMTGVNPDSIRTSSATVELTAALREEWKRTQSAA